MELRHLRYFVAVAEELNFTRAAERLHVSQPPLGQQIRRLEQELGVVLFERTKRRVSLTEAGRVFREAAERTLQQADTAAEVARRAGRGEVGSLTIGFISSASYEVLPRKLRAYRARHPDVRLQLRQMASSKQVRALSDRTLDVGFGGERLQEEWLEQQVVAREPMLAVVPATHPLAGLERIRLRQLAGEPFVMHPRHAAPRNYDRIVGLCQQAGFSPNVEQEALEMQTRAGLVAAGMGVSLLPASVRHLRIDGIACLALEDQIEPVEIIATWRQDDRSPLLERFLEIARKT